MENHSNISKQTVIHGVVETAYTYPGAIQYYGPTEVCDLTTRTLALEKGE